MKSKNIYLPCLFLSLLGLSACTSKTAVDINDYSPNNAGEELYGVEAVRELTLSIDHRCIGCGRCALVDSEHFQIQGRQVQVTS